MLRHRLNPAGHPSIERFGLKLAVGDKVMQLVNDYEREVFNGEIGYVLRIDLKARVLEVDFEGRVVGYDFEAIESLALAYASTIHRAQGCEYPAVVIPLSSRACPDAGQESHLHRHHPRQETGGADWGEPGAGAGGEQCRRHATADPSGT